MVRPTTQVYCVSSQLGVVNRHLDAVKTESGLAELLHIIGLPVRNCITCLGKMRRGNSCLEGAGRLRRSDIGRSSTWENVRWTRRKNSGGLNYNVGLADGSRDCCILTKTRRSVQPYTTDWHMVHCLNYQSRDIYSAYCAILHSLLRSWVQRSLHYFPVVSESLRKAQPGDSGSN